MYKTFLWFFKFFVLNNYFLNSGTESLVLYKYIFSISVLYKKKLLL